MAENNGTPKPGIDAFHRERSKCVDAFSDLEVTIIRLLTCAEIKFGGESFGHKLLKLAKAKPNPRLPKASIAKLPKLIERCEAVCSQRNDIVHSRLQLAMIGDDHKACFVNALDCGKGGQPARLFTLLGLREFTQQVLLLAREMATLEA